MMGKMRRKRFLSIVVFSLAVILLMPQESMGQKRVKQGPPPWAPAHGYRAKTRHLYFPEQNFYFDVQRNVYIFPDGGRWVVSASMPVFLTGIDLRAARKVELEINTDSPQAFNNDHITKYKGDSPGNGKGKGKVPPGQQKKQSHAKGNRK